MYKISAKLMDQLKENLPGLREEAIKMFSNWDCYYAGTLFYSDEELYALLPSSTFEYLTISKRVYLDKELVEYWLDRLPFEYIKYIVMYTAINAVKQLDSAVTAMLGGGVGGTGTPNTVPLWTGTSTLGSSPITAVGGFVGIGTTSPTATFNINDATGTAYSHIIDIEDYAGSNVMSAYAASGQDFITFGSTTTYGVKPITMNGGFLSVNGGGGVAAYFGLSSANVPIDYTNRFDIYNPYYGTHSLMVNYQGNVGINTANPVNGNLEVENTIVGQGNIALYTAATGAGAVNYGIYASAANAGTNYAGYFNGDVYTSGSYLPSDSTLKTNFDSIHNCGSLLCRLKPCTFSYAANNRINLPGGMHYGLLAQDVQNVLPNIVRTIVQPAKKDTAGNIIDSAVSFKAVNYTELVPILVKAYQDQQQAASAQQKSIDSLRNVLNSMKQCIERLCANKAQRPSSDSSNNTQSVTLSSINSPVLYQNTPNPFTIGTKINYYLPEGTQGAMMLFYDMYGNKIKEVELRQNGFGTINVTPDNLKDGVYSYSLIINGQVIDTKKMVLQK
ncbi:MAG TPA: tail fiber domain-containing protein [Bacteroidia bacterium]|nr:tail fiber domain-containing protein [Bacteroidia bacterium]